MTGALDRANAARLREIQEARQEIEVADRLPVWARRAPALLDAIRSDKVKALTALSALKAMLHDSEMPRPDRKCIGRLVRDIEDMMQTWK